MHDYGSRELCDLPQFYDVIQVASGLYKDERSGVMRKDMQIPLLGDHIGEFYPEDFIEEIYNDMYNREDIKFSASNTDFGHSYDGAVSVKSQAERRNRDL